MKKQVKKMKLAVETLGILDSSRLKHLAGGLTLRCDTTTGTYTSFCPDSNSACDSRNTCGSAYC